MSDPLNNPVRTFRMELSFDGTDFHGWQRQPNGISVQQVLEEKLAHLFNVPSLRIQGSSRTDAGVHALGMVASFQAPPSPYIPDWKIQKALNRLLPETIKIRSIEMTDPEFNARFSSQGKAYMYVVNTGELNPFTARWSAHYPDFTLLDNVREAMKFLEGTHDFSTFTVDIDPSKDHVRTIYLAEVKIFGPLTCLCFMGNGFLYKMVRSMTGALLDVGRGRMPGWKIPEMLEAKSRCAAKDTAPAQGLFLLKVFYEPEEWRNFRFDSVPFQVNF